MIVLNPEVGLPFPHPKWQTREGYTDFMSHAKYVVNSINRLNANLKTTPEEDKRAHDILAARSFKTAEQKLAELSFTDENAAVIKKLTALLTAYDFTMIDRATKARTYLVNRLIIESDDPDPKIRLRALELLGKTTEVGAFSERLQVEVIHRTVQQIDTELTETLAKYLGGAQRSELTPTLPVTITTIDNDPSPAN